MSNTPTSQSARPPNYINLIIETLYYLRFVGKTIDDLCVELKDRKVNLSVFAPRKIPFLFKLFEKAGGDLNMAKEKNYAKVCR